MLVKNQCKYSKCSWFMISMPKMPCLWIYDDKSNPYLSGKSGKKAFYIYIKNSGKKAISVMFMILLKCHNTNALLWGNYLTESWGFKLTSFIITINLAGNLLILRFWHGLDFVELKSIHILFFWWACFHLILTITTFIHQEGLLGSYYDVLKG